MERRRFLKGIVAGLGVGAVFGTYAALSLDRSSSASVGASQEANSTPTSNPNKNGVDIAKE